MRFPVVPVLSFGGCWSWFFFVPFRLTLLFAVAWVLFVLRFARFCIALFRTASTHDLPFPCSVRVCLSCECVFPLMLFSFTVTPFRNVLQGFRGSVGLQDQCSRISEFREHVYEGSLTLWGKRALIVNHLFSCSVLWCLFLKGWLGWLRLTMAVI